LFAGDNAWTTGSDVRTKENFSEISGEDFLKKIADFKLTTWNYKTQNPKTFRHYGPMAQDFYAAFGKDEYGTIGNDTTINSADFAGVSFVAIQALEKRTAEYKKEVDELKIENAALRTMLLQLKKEVDGLHGIKKEKL
jgi:Chaperone of endosialidase